VCNHEPSKDRSFFEFMENLMIQINQETILKLLHIGVLLMSSYVLKTETMLV